MVDEAARALKGQGDSWLGHNGSSLDAYASSATTLETLGVSELDFSAGSVIARAFEL